VTAPIWPKNYIEKCYAAVLAFDAKVLESHFENAIVELGLTHLLSICWRPC